VQGVHPLVADERLVQLRLTPQDVHEIVDHAALDPRAPGPGSQADIEVDGDDLLAHQGDAGGDIGCGGGLADPPFARSDDDDFRHVCLHEVKSSPAIH
jgi:hypothetical protein